MATREEIQEILDSVKTIATLKEEIDKLECRNKSLEEEQVDTTEINNFIEQASSTLDDIDTSISGIITMRDLNGIVRSLRSDIKSLIKATQKKSKITKKKSAVRKKAKR